MDYVWSGSVLLLCLGGYVSTSPLVPVPLHYLGVVGTALGVLVHAMRGQWPRGLDVILVLWGVFALGVLVQPAASAEAMQVRVALFTITLLGAVGGAFLLSSAVRVRAFSILVVVLAASYSVAAIVFPANGYRLSVAGTGYIASGRIISAGLVVLLALLMVTGVRWWLLLAIPVAVYLAFQTQTRGPLLAALTAPTLIWLFARSDMRRRARGVTVLLLSAVALVGLLATSVLQNSRFGDLGQGDASVSARWTLFQSAFQLGLSHPLGIGWGNFDSRTPRLPEQYPHNIVLEVWAEGGWLAALAVCVVIGLALWRIRANLPGEAVMLGSLFLFAFLNALVSDDINGNRLLLVLAFAAIAFRQRDGDHVEEAAKVSARAT